MSKLADCVIGMGANLGDRRETLRLAWSALSEYCTVQGVSALYESAALGPPQPDYLNAAVRVDSELAPGELLGHLLLTERAFGRVRRERWGARTLDLDVLWIAGTRLNTDLLSVPHPGLTERAFAILPLLDVAPAATDPVTGIAYRTIASTLDCSGVRRIAGPDWVR